MRLSLPLPENRLTKKLFPKAVEQAESQKSLSELVRILSTGSLFSGMPASQDSFLWAHNSQVWVYRCIRVIVNSAIRMQLRLYRDYTKNGMLRSEEITGGHPALGLLKNPNPNDTAASLTEKIWTSLSVSGMFFNYYDDGRDELWSLRPDRVTINLDKKGFISSFTHTVSGTDTVLPAADVMYGKYYNPSNDYYGLSPMQAATNSISSYLRAQKWNLKYFENSAIPATILTTDHNFNDKDQIELLKKEWNKLYRGFEKAGTTAVLGGGLKVETLTQTHKDMLWDKLQDIARQEISAAFGVTPIFLNTTDGMNYANAREHEKLLWRSKMIPEKILVEQYESKFINKRFAAKGETLRVVYDLSQVEALQEDIVKQADADGKKVFAGLRTLDEQRARDGLDPYPDGIGSRPLVQSAMRPLELVGEPIGGGIVPEPAKHAKSMLPDRDSRLKHWLKTKGIVEDIDAKMKQVLTAIFKDWQAEMISNLESGKAVKGIQVDDVLFDLDKAKEMLEKAGGPLIKEATEEGGKRALATVSTSTAFDVHDPRVEELIKRSVKRFKDYVPHATWERTQLTLADGISEGETVRELADRVRAQMGKEINNASTIARTETLPRYHEGQLEGFEQSGVVENMEWLSAFTETSRDEHTAADGQKAPLGTAFEVGGEMLQYPGDPGGSAENTINCMCDVIAVIEE